MNEFLKKRIERKLESLPDERVYQVLDFIEFLDSKYAARTSTEPTPFQKLAETVEDTLRAGRMSAHAIGKTMDAMSAAGRIMGGLAAAGKSVVDQVAGERKDPHRLENPPASSETKLPPKSDTAPETHTGSA
ncbi:MAG TPA: DUF2281 domain-containing protein [Gemmatimonadales bacterium]|jgi:hypothetical protein